MTLKNVARWAPGGVISFGIALAGVTTAFVIRFLLHPLLQSHFAFVSFTIAVLIVEFFAGLWAALFVLASGLVLGFYFFVPPFDSWFMPEPMDLWFCGAYLSVSLVGIVLIEMLQRARYEARLLRDVAQSRLELLERSIAERERAEQAAKHSEERYHALVSASIPQIWYMRRLDGHFEYLSEQFYQCTGREPGSRHGDIWWETIHPDDVERVRAQWLDVAARGNQVPCGFRLKLADGNYRHIAGRLSCVENEHGKVIKWVAIESERAPDAATPAAG